MQALGSATDQQMPEVRYYLAYARSMTGDTHGALQLTDGLGSRRGGEEWPRIS